MIKQQALNMEELNAENPRDVDLYINHKESIIPYYAIGWEEKFIKSNNIEKAIYNIEKIYELNKVQRSRYKKNTSYNLWSNIWFSNIIPFILCSHIN